ncbi:Mov34/MPN/PAD-1 family protein [Shouchella lehensis]|uniref:MPN domain-containing protein n=1 Tax=Shouchella lehensis G1 TaxID=1246626 RepID=A0A060LY11_9BACI|nr:Mov34/MPN/PAD-1 family protein [Shouchella lehensis]AIC93178.1 hypothetical protein BleG1_0570 [Shouchella lehensis G1]
MNDLIYLNTDMPLKVEIGEQLVKKFSEASQEKYPNETGGILIGKYSTDLKKAIIKEIITEPQDSTSTTTSFFRGTEGLQKLLDESWKREELYYLGEWHYHPLGNTKPSNQDVSEMKKIMTNQSYNCPEPILIIVGHQPCNNISLGVYLFLNGVNYSKLNLIEYT